MPYKRLKNQNQHTGKTPSPAGNGKLPVMEPSGYQGRGSSTGSGSPSRKVHVNRATFLDGTTRKAPLAERSTEGGWYRRGLSPSSIQLSNHFWVKILQSTRQHLSWCVFLYTKDYQWAGQTFTKALGGLPLLVLANLSLLLIFSFSGDFLWKIVSPNIAGVEKSPHWPS